MKKLLITMATVTLVALSVLVPTGCSSPNVLPEVERWDTGLFPTDTAWVAPPQTWISNYSPEDTREQTILLHTPKYYSTTKIVSTVDGDNGILEQYLAVPPDEDLLSSSLTTKSGYTGDFLKMDGYDPETQVVTISGFAPVELDRLVEFSYIPEYVTYAFYWADQQGGSDSGKELVNPPVFASFPKSQQWVTLSCEEANGMRVRESGASHIVIDAPPAEMVKVLVTLDIPETIEIPDNWEFRIGVTETTGREFEMGVTIYVETNYKFLVSSGGLELLEEEE